MNKKHDGANYHNIDCLVVNRLITTGLWLKHTEKQKFRELCLNSRDKKSLLSEAVECGTAVHTHTHTHTAFLCFSKKKINPPEIYDPDPTAPVSPVPSQTAKLRDI